MTGPGLLLHARSRGLYLSLSVVVTIAVLVPLLIRFWWQVSPDTVGGMLLNLVVMSVAAAVAAAGQSLAGADPELEGSVPRIVARFRLAHLTIALLAVGGLLVLGFAVLMPSLDLSQSDQARIILRDSAGLFGLAALTSALVGARFSWAPPTLWVLALSFTWLPRQGWRAAAAMPKAPADYGISALTAIVLLVLGLAAYTARRVSR
jgi:hypothetical protein